MVNEEVSRVEMSEEERCELYDRHGLSPEMELKLKKVKLIPYPL